MSHKVEKRVSHGAGVDVEASRVLWWRRVQFHELGFTLTEAYALADAPADLGDARRLIGSGCPRETAVRILL